MSFALLDPSRADGPGYTVIIESPDDGTVSVYVPNLPGCMVVAA